MSEWLKLANRADLPSEGNAKEFTIRGLTLCVAMINSQPLALDNVCPHRGGPLAEGTIECGKVVCPWHQFEFDLATGASTDNTGLRAASHALRMDGDEVFVRM